MAKLDSELRMLLARKAFFEAHPSAGTLGRAGTDPLYVAIRFHGDLQAIAAAGFTLGNAFGEVAYGETTLAGLEALANHPQVDSIQRQHRERRALDKSVKDIKANLVWGRSGDDFSGYTGREVIVGIIDSGIDFRHHAFRNADGSTRILRIWDQTLTPEGAEKGPDEITHPTIALSGQPIRLAYGVEYEEEQINDTLTESNPDVPVRHKDGNGHGTHVAGIAAGDGSQSGGPGCHRHPAYSYIGVATEARLIVVRKWGLSKGDKDEPPSRAGTKLDAIAYILDQARQFGMPAVINLSIGSFNERMGGDSEDCLAIDALLTNNSQGRAIVHCAGNDAARKFHATGTMPANLNDTLRLNFTVKKDDSKRRNLVVLYSGANLEAKVISPVGGDDGEVDWVAFGDDDSSSTANGSGSGSLVTIDNREADRIGIEIMPPDDGKNVPGTWSLELRTIDGVATPIDALCVFGHAHDKKSIAFTSRTTSRSTLWSDATGLESISVGSCKINGGLSRFSARGPTRDAGARTKPELAAPGEDITSAGLESDRHCERCCCDCCVKFYVDKSGTSMAAPHVSGVIALMLHKNPNLTHTEIRDLLVGNTTAKPTDATLAEDLGWGAGRLNAERVVGAVTQVNPPVARTAVALEPLAALHATVLATERGPELQRLFDRFAGEVWALIQHNRRVATVWHRCRGPVWVRLALRAAHAPDAQVPLAVDGLSLSEGLARFSAALERYGSAALARELRALAPALARITDSMTLSQIIETAGVHLPDGTTPPISGAVRA